MARKPSVVLGVINFLKVLYFTLPWSLFLGAVVVAPWIYVAVALTLPNPWRAVTIWTLIIGLSILVPDLDFSGRA